MIAVPFVPFIPHHEPERPTVEWPRDSISARKVEKPFVYARAWFCPACGAGHGLVKDEKGERVVLFDSHAKLRAALATFAKGKRLQVIGTAVIVLGALTIGAAAIARNLLLGKGEGEWITYVASLPFVIGPIIQARGQKKMHEQSAFLRTLERKANGWTCSWYRSRKSKGVSSITATVMSKQK